MNTDITKQMEMLLYRTEDDNVIVSALIKDEMIWLTQKAMAELFGIDKSGICLLYTSPSPRDTR